MYNNKSGIVRRLQRNFWEPVKTLFRRGEVPARRTRFPVQGRRLSGGWNLRRSLMGGFSSTPLQASQLAPGAKHPDKFAHKLVKQKVPPRQFPFRNRTLHTHTNYLSFRLGTEIQLLNWIRLCAIGSRNSPPSPRRIYKQKKNCCVF